MKNKQGVLTKERAKIKIAVLQDKRVLLTISSKKYHKQTTVCQDVDEMIGVILGFMDLDKLLLQ